MTSLQQSGLKLIGSTDYDSRRLSGCLGSDRNSIRRSRFGCFKTSSLKVRDISDSCCLLITAELGACICVVCIVWKPNQTMFSYDLNLIFLNIIFY